MLAIKTTVAKNNQKKLLLTKQRMFIHIRSQFYVNKYDIYEKNEAAHIPHIFCFSIFSKRFLQTNTCAVKHETRLQDSINNPSPKHQQVKIHS
jgi:hypothetical protein